MMDGLPYINQHASNMDKSKIKETLCKVYQKANQRLKLMIDLFRRDT